MHLRGGDSGEETIDLGPDDYVFATLGSMTADSSYGDGDRVPERIR